MTSSGAPTELTGDESSASAASSSSNVPQKERSAVGKTLSNIWGTLAGSRRAVVQRWRRSLQFRTVVTTLLIVSIAVMGVGGFLSGQIANGLFKERLAQALQDSARGTGQVQASFSGASIDNFSDLSNFVLDQLRVLTVGSADDTRKYLMVKYPNQTSRLSVGSSDSGGVTTAIIPDALRAAVQADSSGQYWESIALPVGDSGVHPAVVVGSTVELYQTKYELYMIYDLEGAQTTLNYIQSVLWLAGAMLLALIGAITWYVTRTVVKPVSEAADVSEKLAAGGLEERMNVVGEDEMARLAASFNKMATSLQDQINALETLSEMQQRFVSDVSHELRTPLTTVRMAAEVLYAARDDFDPVNKRSSELLLHQVERFELLLADLLEISRFDAGVAKLDVEQLDIFSVIHSVIEGAMPVAHANHSELSVVTRLKGRHCIVEMDSRRIDRILRNLVVNALEHSDGNPVKIFVSADEQAVAVAVRDYGIGLSPDGLSHVFDRFWRADPARARTTGGSGLGLSIAMEDTRLHGGWLDAWGSPGNGSCFRLTIPLKEGQEFSHSPVPLPPDGGDVVNAHTLSSGPVLTNTGAMGVVGALGSVNPVVALENSKAEVRHASADDEPEFRRLGPQQGGGVS